LSVLYSRKKRNRDRAVRCYLTLDCNGGCLYCSADIPCLPTRVKQYIQPPDVWAEGINRRGRECILAGGEPFLYPYLTELVNMINVRMQIYTNLKCDVSAFLSDCKKSLNILASNHQMSGTERILWLKNAKAMIDAGHHLRFHIVKVDGWQERVDFIRNAGIENKITVCDDQRSGIKSSGQQTNNLMSSVSCSSSIYLYGPGGYRYPCVTLMGKGENKQEHISEADAGDTITLASCVLFGLCVGCDNNIEGEVRSSNGG
jgi:organic radical activating enzyme